MRNGKRIVITYGTYDLLHYGHIRFLKRARALGDYLIVGVTSDAFDRDRGKLNVFQSLSDRISAIEALGIADKVVVEEYQGQKIEDIRKYGVDIFAIGSDWTGKFDYLNKYCKVVYLDRTEGVSSTELRADKANHVRLGCIGADYLVGRLAEESKHVPNLQLTSIYPFEGQDASNVAAGLPVTVASSVADLVDDVDAVYISARIDRREALIREALSAGCHVLCESPAFLSVESAQSLLDLARSQGLVLMEAVKTLFFPAFKHLKLLLESGVVGEIKDIRASYSHVFDELDRSDPYEGSFYDMGAYTLLPAMALIGRDYIDSQLTCYNDGDFNLWTKCDLLYPTASATLSCGRGMKTEGDMVITGTDGYVYVPAPWWKIEYFEVRGEDLRSTRKYYFECTGQGQRYELFEFTRRIDSLFREPGIEVPFSDSIIATTELIEKFDRGEVRMLGDGAYTFGGGERIVDR